MPKTFDYPLDMGIVLHTTCDEVWEEEMARHDGLLALRRLCECESPRTCEIGSTRKHFQLSFANTPPELLLIAIERLTPHKDASLETLHGLLHEIAQDIVRRTPETLLEKLVKSLRT